MSVMLQLPIYYLLNRQIEKVMTPATTQPIVRTLKTTISGTNFKNMQISYGKDYIAYEENGILKVYNLKQDKQVLRSLHQVTTKIWEYSIFNGCLTEIR